MHYSCLIVDDETELAETTAEYFKMFEVSTHFVTSAEACYAFFEDNSADLILLDINLGDGSGFEVCKRLREDMQLPILFISARQSDDGIPVGNSRDTAGVSADAFTDLPGKILQISHGGIFTENHTAVLFRVNLQRVTFANLEGSPDLFRDYNTA